MNHYTVQEKVPFKVSISKENSDILEHWVGRVLINITADKLGSGLEGRYNQICIDKLSWDATVINWLILQIMQKPEKFSVENSYLSDLNSILFNREKMSC